MDPFLQGDDEVCSEISAACVGPPFPGERDRNAESRAVSLRGFRD
jgi:hypothetical protein